MTLEAADASIRLKSVLLEKGDFDVCATAFPRVRRAMFPGSLLLGASALAVVGVGVTTNPAVAFGGVLVAAITYRMMISASREATQKAHGNTPAGSNPYDFSFDRDGFRATSVIQESFTRWTAVFAVEEHPQAFLLVFTPTSQLILPKRFFLESDAARFKDLIEALGIANNWNETTSKS